MRLFVHVAGCLDAECGGGVTGVLLRAQTHYLSLGF